MKLYNLSITDSCSCFVLKFKSCTIMLDCALDFSSCSNFLPIGLIEDVMSFQKYELKDPDGKLVTNSELVECGGVVFINSSPEFCPPETDLLDLSTVDVILVSNYLNMLALPYITEYCGFQGAVYATEPTLQIGRLLMKEIVHYCNRIPKSHQAVKWKNRSHEPQLPGSLKNVCRSDSLSWRCCYSKNDLINAMSKVHVVSYAEKINIFGMLNVEAHSSGFVLGSCNWLIESNYEKVTYISDSSSLTTHPQPMSVTPLKNSDILIFTGLSTNPINNPDNMLSEFCSCLAMTVKAGGNVLVPCFPSGLVYDLLECLLTYMDQPGLSTVPIYFISPVAKDSLAFSQVYGEWLHPNKQDNIYLPEPPFVHDELIDTGKLKVFSGVHDGLSSTFKKPCIVFAGHPSLRFGDAVHFVELWKNFATNSIIFVEPNMPFLEALAPFQPIKMHAYHFEINTRMNHTAAINLLNDLNAKTVVAPSSYTKSPVLNPHRTDLHLQINSHLLPIQRKSVLPLDVKRKYEQIELLPDLASTLMPAEVKPGVLLAAVSGELESANNKYTLKIVTKQNPGSRKRRFQEASSLHRPLIWGKLILNNLVKNLKEEGYSDAKIEKTPTGHMVVLKNIIIQIEDGSTHIVCEGTENLRIKLRDILLRSMSGP